VAITGSHSGYRYEDQSTRLLGRRRGRRRRRCIARGASGNNFSEGRFRLGSVTYNLLKDYDVDAIIKMQEAVGFEAAELRTERKHSVEPSISAADRTRIRRRFESSKVRLLSYGTTCRFQSPDVKERNRQLEIAKMFVDLARYRRPGRETPAHGTAS
jgi:hypothetical protein